jgi:hypothetical protein
MAGKRVTTITMRMENQPGPDASVRFHVSVAGKDGQRLYYYARLNAEKAHRAAIACKGIFDPPGFCTHDTGTNLISMFSTAYFLDACRAHPIVGVEK